MIAALKVVLTFIIGNLLLVAIVAPGVILCLGLLWLVEFTPPWVMPFAALLCLPVMLLSCMGMGRLLSPILNRELFP